MTNPERTTMTNDGDGEYAECWQCYGEGMLAGCFEDTCCGADCDPEDPVYCCAPSKCDVCEGKGRYLLVEQNKDRPDDE